LRIFHVADSPPGWFLVLAAALPLSQVRAQPAPVVPVPKTTSSGTLSGALSYGSNTVFYGRIQSTPYPYRSAELTYTSKWGIWGSVVASDLLATSALVDETDLLAGWDGDLTKKLDASVSYAHFFFAPNSPLIKSSVSNSVQMYVGYDWGHAYTRVNGDFLFGPDSRDGFIVLDNSRYIALRKLGCGVLSTEPKVSVIAGTQNFDSVSVVQQLIRGNSAGKGNGKKKGHYTTVTSYSTRFTLLACELQVPLRYTLGKVAGEVAYRYLLPMNTLTENGKESRSYFTASFLVSF
jgi:hypothetical protein